MEYKSFLKTVGGGEGQKCHYPTRLDVYGCGCEHGCKYCYARSLLDFRGLWGKPRVADIKAVRRAVKRLKPGTIVRMGGMTDCFAPIEREQRVALETIRALNKQRVGYLIVTKSDLIADYAPELDKDLAHIQISVTSTDDDISRKMEPGAPLPEQRIEALERLFKAGFDVQLRLSPYIPENVDTGRINAVECDRMLVEFLRVNSAILKLFPVDLSEYSLRQGNYYHLPLERKKRLLRAFSGKEITVCEDVDEHYKHWQSNFNPNPGDCCNLRKAGENDKRISADETGRPRAV